MVPQIPTSQKESARCLLLFVCFVLDMNRTAHSVLHLLLIFFQYWGSVQTQGFAYSDPGSTIELQPQVNAVVVRLIECSCRLFALPAVEHLTVGGAYGQSVPSPVGGHWDSE